MHRSEFHHVEPFAANRQDHAIHVDHGHSSAVAKRRIKAREQDTQGRSSVSAGGGQLRAEQFGPRGKVRDGRHLLPLLRLPPLDQCGIEKVNEQREH